jgi:hypothetical protein
MNVHKDSIFENFVLKSFQLIFAPRTYTFILQGFHKNADLVTRFPRVLRVWRLLA